MKILIKENFLPNNSLKDNELQWMKQDFLSAIILPAFVPKRQVVFER